MAERIKGVQIHRPIIYGSHARLLTEEEKLSAPIGHTHRWTVFLTSATSPPPDRSQGQASSSSDPFPEDMNYIPGGLDDLSYLIKKVTFRLHDTYPNPNRVFDKPPFQVSETGWGEFIVQIRIQFVQESAEKPMTLNHPIKLHHWGPPIEGAISASGALIPGGGTGSSGLGLGSAAPTPIPAPAAEQSVEGVGTPGNGEGSVKPKSETAGTPVPASSTSTSEAVPKTEVEMGTPATVTPGATPAVLGEEATAPNTPAEQIEVEPTQLSSTSNTFPGAGAGAGTGDDSQPLVLSIAAKMPVHSWQYDELIFSDPPKVFYDILNAHPPTPLPGRNRRPRDQRDEVDRKFNSKKKKPLPPVSVRNSRANTIDSTHQGAAVTPSAVPSAVDTPAAAAATGTGHSVVFGKAGEPGSADVPLEFTAEMEKAEWNRLNDARVKIVEQMDRWRERLIAQEKELAKLKEEVKAVS